MATSAQRSFEFDYKEFLRRLEKERLSPDQKGPMNLRLQLLESFMDVDGSNDEDDSETTCWICAEPVKFYSLSECNHRTCHVCALRLRALYKKLDCTFCKVS